MGFRTAFAPPRGAAIAQEDDVRIEMASEDAERFAIGRPPEIAATLFGRLPDCTGLRDIFSRVVRLRIGGLT